jgi:5'-nucleotidase
MTLDGKLVVAISSRALFDFEEENLVFEQSDDRAYMDLQLQRLDIPAKPGVAFSLIKKLLAFNRQLPSPQPSPEGRGGVQPPFSHDSALPPLPQGEGRGEGAVPETQRNQGIHPVEVVILSRNDPVSGMRVFRSAQHYGLTIERGSFTRGQAPWRYLKPLHANLFLSTHLSDVRAALAAGVPAAQVYPNSVHASDAHPSEVRIAFDGDAVLFSDEAERVYQTLGLQAFQRHEIEKATQPLPDGPFKPLLVALQNLQQSGTPQMRIRTALVTARSAPAHERAIRTLMNWNIEVDEAMFLGGLSKGEFLREFEPDFFFDDQTGHIESAAQHVPSGHVASGVRN